MITDKFGQYVYTEDDVLDIVMRGNNITNTKILVNDIDPSDLIPSLIKYIEPDVSTQSFDILNQKKWHMPEKYMKMDIAEHVLSLCSGQTELQRCGKELIMFQERNLFNLLRYMKYLVDVMTENNIIWGVGRGSSVSSYVLYKLKIHKVDSMFYNLDVGEFLR